MPPARHRSVAQPVGLGLVLVGSLWAPPAAAQGEGGDPPGDLIVLSGDVAVRRGEEADEVVVLHGDATAAGVVHGDVVVLDGRIEVTGQVGGSVVNVTGPVTLGPSSQVGGDVLAHGRVRARRGAQVGGDVREHASFSFRTPIDALGRLAPWLAIWASVLGLGLLALATAPKAVDAVAVAAYGAPWASLGWGVVVSVAIPVGGILGVISLVWLPLGLGVLLSLVLLSSVGVAWSAFALGRLVWREPRGRILAYLLGWAIVAAVAAIPFVGGVIWVVGSAFGLGASTVAIWRVRRETAPSGGRHRPGGKMPSASRRPAAPQPMVVEREMREEGTGL